MPLPLASGSVLRKLSASQSSDSSPSMAVEERPRKNTNANEITDEESTEVRGRLANMRERLRHVQVKGARNEIEEMMESYVMQCEKANESRKSEELPKILLTELDEQKRERQDKALAKPSSPSKVAETVEPTPAVTTTSASASTIAVASTKVKDEGRQQIKQNEKKGDADEVFPIELDLESNTGLVIDEPSEEMPKQSTGTEKAMQLASADMSATLLATCLQAPLDGEQEEEEMETGEVVEANIPTLEELASAVLSSPTPTLISILSTVLCAHTPTPIHIYSMVTSVPQVPPSPTPIPTITNCKAIFANPAIISYAFGQGPHPSSTVQQGALVQPKMSAQAPISSPFVALIHPFNIDFDPADMDFLKRKLTHAQKRQKNVLLEAGQLNPNCTIVAVLERALHDGSAMAVTKPMQTQLQTDREQRMTVRMKEVLVAPRLLNLVSPTPSAGSPLMRTVPSTIPFSVVTSSPVPLTYYFKST